MNAFAALSISDLVALSAIAALGGFFRGFSGFGSTMAMVPLFTIIIEPVPAVFIGLSLDVIATIPLTPQAYRHAQWRDVAPLTVGYFVGAPLGAYVLLVTAASTMRIAIAVVIMVAGLAMLSGRTYSGPRTLAAALAVGGLSGVTGTAVGIGGPPLALYMLAGQSTAQQMRAAMLMMSLVMEAFSALIIFLGATLQIWVFVTLATLLPAMLLSTWVGTRAFLGISEAGFRKSALWLVVIVGAAIIARILLV